MGILCQPFTHLIVMQLASPHDSCDMILPNHRAAGAVRPHLVDEPDSYSIQLIPMNPVTY